MVNRCLSTNFLWGTIQNFHTWKLFLVAWKFVMKMLEFWFSSSYIRLVIFHTRWLLPPPVLVAIFEFYSTFCPFVFPSKNHGFIETCAKTMSEDNNHKNRSVFVQTWKKEFVQIFILCHIKLVFNKSKLASMNDSWISLCRKIFVWCTMR